MTQHAVDGCPCARGLVGNALRSRSLGSAREEERAQASRYEIFISAARNLFSPLEDLEEWPFIGLSRSICALLMDEIGFIGGAN